MSETSKGRIVRKFSKTLVTLSDAPRRPCVDVQGGGGSLHGHSVSAPIAKRIQNLYHAKPVEQRRTSGDEKHPMVLKRYDRGVSDTAAVVPGNRSGSTRAYRSADDGADSGHVYIRLGGGEELVFNDDLDALELSPTATEPPVLNTAPDGLALKTASLPRGRSNHETMREFSDKKRSSSVPRTLHSKQLTLHGASDPESCDMDSEYGSESDAPRSGVLVLDNGSTERQNESSTDDVLDSTGDRIMSTSSDESALDTKRNQRKSLYTSNIRRTPSQSPSSKKIDKYRASLRRRKAEQRSKSEPRIGDKDFYHGDSDREEDSFHGDSSREEDIYHGDRMDTETSEASENKENNIPVTRGIGNDSAKTRGRTLYEPRPGARPTSHLVRSSNITRSSSLSSLYRCNSLDDIPKGIAKSKIKEIQKRVDDERKQERISRSPSHSSVGSPRVQSPTPKTVISPGGRITSPDAVSSPRNIVSQRIAPSRSATPMFFGGVPVSGQGQSSGEEHLKPASGATLVPPPRRSRSRNTSKTVSSVFNPFSYPAPIAAPQTGKTNISAPKKAPLPESVAKSVKRLIPDLAPNRHSLPPKEPAESSLKRSLEESQAPQNSEIAFKRPSIEAAQTHGKRPSSVPPCLAAHGKASKCPPTIIPPPRKKGLAPKVPSVKIGVSSIKRRQKGPAPLPPRNDNEKSTVDTPAGTSTDETSSSGDSTSVQSAEGIIAMETSDSGSSSEPIESKDTQLIKDNCPPIKDSSEQPITDKDLDNEPIRDSDDEYLDGDRPLTFTGLDLDDFSQMPVLLLEGVTNSSSCDYDEDEANENAPIANRSLDVNMNKDDDYSNDMLNTSGNSETDSVTTVVEREPVYIDMSRSSSMTEDSDYVTMDSVESGGHVTLNMEQLNNNYINANTENTEAPIIPAPENFEDSPNTSITEAPTEFQDNYHDSDSPIYSTIERGVTLPRQISTSSNLCMQDNVPGAALRLAKSDSGDTLDSFAESTDSGISGPASESQTLEEDTDDTLVDRNKCTADFSSSEDTLDDLDMYDPLYETIENIQKAHEGVANRPRELALLMQHADEQNDKVDATETTPKRKISDQSPVSPISPLDTSQKTKSKSKTKKKNKKSRKKDRSPSPTKREKAPPGDRVSSDEDLLNERRKRAMSPGAIARDFVVKMIRGRPNSPKDKSEKILSPLDSSGRKSPFSLKKIATSPVITKSVTYLPTEFDGPPQAMNRKTSSPATFQLGSDKRSSFNYENHNGDHRVHTPTGFNINRYAGEAVKSSAGGRPPFERASKSMGDLYEAMGGKKDNVESRVIHEDPQTSAEVKPSASRRTLPLIPMKHVMPILVKVIGKDEDMECQNTGCTSEDTQAVKVCHHGDCQEKNNQQPLMLCHACDESIHADPEYSGHLRFDVFRKGTLNRNSSLRSLQGLSQSEDEGGDVDNVSDVKKSSKSKRKKGLPLKRHHTADIDQENAALPPSGGDPNDNDYARRQESDDANSDDEEEDDGVVNRADSLVTSTALEVVDEDGAHPREITDSSKKDTQVLNEGVDSGVHESRDSTLTNEQEDKLIVNQSNDSIQFQSKSLPSEESSILQSSPFSNGTTNNSEHSPKHGDTTVQLDESFDEDIDGIGRSKTYKLDTQLPYTEDVEQDKQQSSKKPDVTSSQKQTTPTTPKTPPGVPELLKKYSMGGEYFTLKLDVLEEQDVYEIVAAEKGVSLRDAVRCCLERRGINVNSVDIYLASSNTPLPLIADCYMLGGNHLHVKAKENNEQSNLTRSYRSASTTSLANGKQQRPAALKDKTPKQAIIYLKREHNHRSSIGGSPHHVMNPPVMHRRSSLKPKHLPNAIKTEQHPIANQMNVSSDDSDGCDDGEGDNTSCSSINDESQRGKKSEDSGISSDVSPAGTFTSTDTAKYKELIKQQTKFGKLFSPFGKGQQEKHEYLLHQLDHYSTNGLPPMPALLVMGSPKYDDASFEIESHWSKLVGIEPSALNKKQKDQQEAIWELVHTEVQYIRKLQVVIDLFYCCLMDLQNDGLLCEIKTEEVFSNIIEVCQCSQAFWINYMSHIVDQSRRTRQLLDPALLTDGFMKFDEIFHPYAKYCLEQKGCSDYIKNNVHDNDLFRIFIQWAEAQKQCKRLKLQDLVISPMQRLTKYKLLLKAILKKTEKEHNRKDLIQMIDKVDRFVLQVNTVMHQRAEHERLSMIIDRIEAYDVIDTPNDEVQKLMGDFCKLDLTCPVPGCGPQQRRHLLLEGGLKFRDSVSKMDVYCFLFTDMLLITKPNRRGDKVKVTKPPMRLDKCVVHMLRDGVSFALLYLNEYHMATAVHTFHGEAAKVWVDHIRRAQDAYKSLRKSAVERSERHMYWEMFYEENYEDELAVINSSRPQPSPESVERQDSTGSLESYACLDAMPRSVSQNALRHGSEADKRGLRNSASLDENAMYNQARENVQRSDSEPSRTQMLSLPRPSVSEYNLSDSSPSGSPALARNPHERHVSKKHKLRAESRRTDSQSSGEGATLSRSHSGSRYKTLPHETVPEEQVRSGRLNQRRISRGDKRWYTADAIEDIRKESRDATIQKRMSWNYGTVDINIDEKQNYLRTKTVSSDSLRSMPSSSGVSSTGSLHLSPESEIYEEEYEDDGEPDCAMLNDRGTSPHVHFVDQHSDGSSTNESSVTLTETLDREDSDSDSELKARNSHSKSLPNISSINIRDVQDGVGSAEVRHESAKKKMSPGEFLRMKKQLLLNSTLEASEV